MTRKLLAYIRILRPLNFLFVLIAVLFGAYFRINAIPLLYPILAGIAAAVISGGGYVLNDYYDYQIDVINRKSRVLPSGLMSPSTAKYYAWGLLILGVIITVFLHNPWMITLSIINSFLLYFYAKKGKSIHIWGNLLVAFVTASTFIFGSFLSTNLYKAGFVAICAFFYTLIRELVKDIEDEIGDSSIGSKTIPILLGTRKTLLFSLIFWVCFSIIIILGYPNFYSFTFFMIILICIVLLLLIDIVFLYVTQNKNMIKISEKFMKVHMLIFLILLWVAQ